MRTDGQTDREEDRQTQRGMLHAQIKVGRKCVSGVAMATTPFTPALPSSTHTYVPTQDGKRVCVIIKERVCVCVQIRKCFVQIDNKEAGRYSVVCVYVCVCVC